MVETILHEAATSALHGQALQSAVLRALAGGVDVSALDGSGETCLHVAARFGAAPLVRLLCTGAYAVREDVVEALWTTCPRGRRPVETAHVAYVQRAARPHFVDVASVSAFASTEAILSDATRGSVVRQRALRRRRLDAASAAKAAREVLRDARKVAAVATALHLKAVDTKTTLAAKREAARAAEEAEVCHKAGLEASLARHSELMAEPESMALLAQATEESELALREELRASDARMPADVVAVARKRALSKLTGRARRRAEAHARADFRKAFPPPFECPGGCHRAFMTEEEVGGHLKDAQKCRLKRASSSRLSIARRASKGK